MIKDVYVCDACGKEHDRKHSVRWFVVTWAPGIDATTYADKPMAWHFCSPTCLAEGAVKMAHGTTRPR